MARISAGLIDTIGAVPCDAGRRSAHNVRWHTPIHALDELAPPGYEKVLGGTANHGVHAEMVK